MKKRLFCIMLAVTMLLTGCGKSKNQQRSWDSTDTESRYPYSYEQKKDGLHISIQGEFGKGSKWQAESGNDSVLSAAVSKSGSSKAEVVVTPHEMGEAEMTMTLVDSATGNASYVIRTFLTVSGSMSVEVLENTSNDVSAGAEGAFDEVNSYAVSGEADGTLDLALIGQDILSAFLAIPEEGSPVKKLGLEVTEGHVDFEQANVLEDRIVFPLRGEQAETCRIIMHTGLAKDLELELTAQADGSLMLDAHNVVDAQ